MTWRLARSLVTLRSQVNLAHPGRYTGADGSIGDAAHQRTGSASDHNPWYGPGIVTAVDISHDPRHGFDIDSFTDELQAAKDLRIKYVIANGAIMSGAFDYAPWVWRKYNGDNPHTSHVHISVRATPICDDASLWNIPSLRGTAPAPSPAPAPGPAPTPGVGAPAFPLRAGQYYGPLEGPAESISGRYSGDTQAQRDGLAMWQRRMSARGWTIGVDGKYGPQTRGVALAFQREKGLFADGLIGPATWYAAWTAPVT